MTAITCECCWIASVNVSLADPGRYCKACRAHTGSLPNLRVDHRKLVSDLQERQAVAIQHERGLGEKVRSELIAVIAERDALVQSAATTVADLIEAGLPDSIKEAVQTDLEGRLKSAYSTRDRAMSAVWRIDTLHHAPLRGDKCECGRALRDCREFGSLAFFRESFYGWERRQMDLMRDNKHHGLPRDHPEATSWMRGKRDWDWKGAPSTEPEARRGVNA